MRALLDFTVHEILSPYFPNFPRSKVIPKEHTEAGVIFPSEVLSQYQRQSTTAGHLDIALHNQKIASKSDTPEYRQVLVFLDQLRWMCVAIITVERMDSTRKQYFPLLEQRTLNRLMALGGRASSNFFYQGEIPSEQEIRSFMQALRQFDRLLQSQPNWIKGAEPEIDRKIASIREYESMDVLGRLYKLKYTFPPAREGVDQILWRYLNPILYGFEPEEPLQSIDMPMSADPLPLDAWIREKERLALSYDLDIERKKVATELHSGRWVVSPGDDTLPLADFGSLEEALDFWLAWVEDNLEEPRPKLLRPALE